MENLFTMVLNSFFVFFLYLLKLICFILQSRVIQLLLKAAIFRTKVRLNQAPPPKKRGPDKKPRKRGKHHGNYIHGQGKTRDYDPQLHAVWKQGVLQKDNFRCFITGETDSNKLHCHHLNGWDAFKDERYSIANGITITSQIHQNFHKEYGFGSNTREQFEHFLEKEFNITTYPWRDVNHEPNLSAEQLREKQKTMQEKFKENLLNLIKERNHQLFNADGFFSHSKIKVSCPTQNMKPRLQTIKGLKQVCHAVEKQSKIKNEFGVILTQRKNIYVNKKRKS